MRQSTGVRVVCTACPWKGWRHEATLGENPCPKCRADVRRLVKVRKVDPC